MTSINPNYSEALSVAIANYSKELADNITNSNVLLSFMKRKGNIETFPDGTEIAQGLSIMNGSSAQWYSRAETLNVTGSESISTANFAIKQAMVPVSFDGMDQMVHANGPSQIHNFFKNKIKNAESDLENAVAEAMYYSNTEHSGKAIGGLQHLVSDTGTGTVGGIDSSSVSEWQNYVYDFSAKSKTAGKDTIVSAINEVYAKVKKGNSNPDLIIGGWTYFNYFEENLQDKQRFQDADQAKAGFDGYRYKTAFVMHDELCSDTRMYVLNTKYLHWRPHKDRNFTTSDRKDSVNQDAYVVPIFFGGNMTVSGRKYQGVIVA